MRIACVERRFYDLENSKSFVIVETIKMPTIEQENFSIVDLSENAKNSNFENAYTSPFFFKLVFRAPMTRNEFLGPPFAISFNIYGHQERDTHVRNTRHQSKTVRSCQ